MFSHNNVIFIPANTSIDPLTRQRWASVEDVRPIFCKLRFGSIFCICPDLIISKYKGVSSVTLCNVRYDPNATTRHWEKYNRKLGYTCYISPIMHTQHAHPMPEKVLRTLDSTSHLQLHSMVQARPNHLHHPLHSDLQPHLVSFWDLSARGRSAKYCFFCPYPVCWICHTFRDKPHQDFHVIVNYC